MRTFQIMENQLSTVLKAVGELQIKVAGQAFLILNSLPVYSPESSHQSVINTTKTENKEGNKNDK